MLIALAAKVGHPFAAQKGKIALDPGLHCPAGKIAVWLSVSLTVEDVRPDVFG